MNSLPTTGCSAKDGVYGKNASQHLLPISMWVFFSFAQCVGVAHLVFGFLSEETVLYLATDLVCLWEEVQNPPTSPS